MKILDVSSISDTSQLPIKKGTLSFLQAVSTELTHNLIKTLGGSHYNGDKVHILYGCVNSGYENSYIISDGAVYYHGEMFYFPATSFVVPSGQNAWFFVHTEQYTSDADPVTFTDGAVRSIHNNRFMTASGATSGIDLFSNRLILKLSPADVYDVAHAEITTEADNRALGDEVLSGRISPSEAHVANTTNYNNTYIDRYRPFAVGTISLPDVGGGYVGGLTFTGDFTVAQCTYNAGGGMLIVANFKSTNRPIVPGAYRLNISVENTGNIDNTSVLITAWSTGGITDSFTIWAQEGIDGIQANLRLHIELINTY